MNIQLTGVHLVGSKIQPIKQTDDSKINKGIKAYSSVRGHGHKKLKLAFIDNKPVYLDLKSCGKFLYDKDKVKIMDFVNHPNIKLIQHVFDSAAPDSEQTFTHDQMLKLKQLSKMKPVETSLYYRFNRLSEDEIKEKPYAKCLASLESDPYVGVAAHQEMDGKWFIHLCPGPNRNDELNTLEIDALMLEACKKLASKKITPSGFFVDEGIYNNGPKGATLRNFQYWQKVLQDAFTGT